MPNDDASGANRVGSDRIEPGDPRYADLVGRGFNKRFTGKPDYVRMVASSAQVVDAVLVAVRDGMRPVLPRVSARDRSWNRRPSAARPATLFVLFVVQIQT